VEIYGELEPSRNPRIVLERARLLAELYRRVDVPDIPLGKPNISSPVMSAYVLHSLRADVIAHVRVIDHNIVSLKSIVKTLSYINIKKIIFLRGDPPQQGQACEGHWQPEEAVGYAQKYGVDAGLLISPRKPLNEIRQRLAVGASAYYVTRVEPSHNTRARIKSIIDMVIRAGAAPGLYVVVGSRGNVEYLSRYGIPYVPVDKLREILEWAERLRVERIILSAPGAGDSLLSEDVVEGVRPWLPT